MLTLEFSVFQLVKISLEISIYYVYGIFMFYLPTTLIFKMYDSNYLIVK